MTWWMNALASRLPDLARLNHVLEVRIGAGRNCGYSRIHHSARWRCVPLLLFEGKMNSFSMVDDQLIMTHYYFDGREQQL